MDSAELNTLPINSRERRYWRALAFVCVISLIITGLAVSQMWCGALSRRFPSVALRMRGWELRHPERTEGSDSTYVRFCGDVASASDIALLASIENVYSIEIEVRQWESGTLSTLSKHSSLRILDISGITDRDAPVLAAMNLIVLRIADSPNLTDGGITYIQSITTLRNLTLTDTGITDHGVATIAQMNFIENLSLGRERIATQKAERCPITDRGVRQLKSLTHVKRLYLVSTRLTDDGLQDLGFMPTLDYLAIDGSDVTVDGLRHLAGLPELKKISALHTSIGASDVEKIVKTLPTCEVQWHN